MLQRRFNHFVLVAGLAAASALGVQSFAVAGAAQPFYGESASVIASPALTSVTTRAAVTQGAVAAMRDDTLKFGEVAGLPLMPSARSDVTRSEVKDALRSETVAEHEAMRQLYLD